MIAFGVPLPTLEPGPTDPSHSAIVRDARAGAGAIVAAAAVGRLGVVQADARLEARFWLADAELAWAADRSARAAGAEATRRALDLAFCALREEVGRLFHV